MEELIIERKIWSSIMIDEAMVKAFNKFLKETYTNAPEVTMKDIAEYYFGKREDFNLIRSPELPELSYTETMFGVVCDWISDDFIEAERYNYEEEELSGTYTYTDEEGEQQTETFLETFI